MRRHLAAHRIAAVKIATGTAVAALLFTASGSIPAAPDVPVTPAGLASGTPQWSDEPSAATLAAWGNRTHEAEQFYFVLPDRFANGDPRNDRGGLPERAGSLDASRPRPAPLADDRLSTGYDPTDKGFYHGGDLAGLIDRLDYIQGLGTTAIWLAPVFKNRPVQGSGNDISAGYHGYWITDFTSLDPHFGTKADLERLIRLSHRRGMKVYLDVIVNHTADVIRYAQNQYSYRNKTDFPYRDSAGRPFDDHNHADGTRGFPQVNAQTSFPYTPVFASDADRTVKKPAWLNDPTMYHNRGDSTFAGESSEYGDFFGLDDLWTERPEVVRGMTEIYANWIESTGVDGFRIDTVKHSNIEFWPQWAAGIQRAANRSGNRDFFMFGEVFSAEPELTSTYVRRGGLPSTLDFPFQELARNYVARGGSASEMARLYESDDLYTARNTDARALPTFLGNHDMGRIGNFVATGGTPSAEHLRRDQLAHELMFLTRGQPVVYSGDEQGFTGAGGDKDARQDMFASRSADYLDDDLLGTDRTHAVDQYDRTHPIYRSIASLGALRKAHPALANGVQVTRFAADGPGVFAFSRIDPAQRVEYVVAVNNSGTPQAATIPTYSAGVTFDRIYGGDPAIAATDQHRNLNVTVPPLSAVVYKARRALGQAATGPRIQVSTPQAVARAEVTATVEGDPLASVAFAVKVGSGGWKLLGTASKAPYRVYHDLNGLPAGTGLEYKAVVRDGLGRTASARSTATVGTPSAAPSRDHIVVHYQRPAGNYDPWGLYAWGDIDPGWQTPWPTGQPFAGEDSYGRFTWVKVKPGARNVGFLVVDSNGVKDVEVDRFVDPSATPEIWLNQGDPKIYPSRAAASGHLQVHYGRPDGAYAGWGLHLWGDGLAPGVPTEWTAPRQPDGTDTYGAYWNVPLADPTKPVNFIVHNGDLKDPGPDQSAVPADQPEAWVRSGEHAVHKTRAAAAHTAVLHYRRADGDYTGWGLHVWNGAATPTDWANPLMPARIDSYGAVFVVPLADNATELAYIVHKGDAKDLPADQVLDLVDVGHEVWLLAGQPRYLLPMPLDAAPDIDLTKSRAHWIDRSTIAWRVGPTDGRAYELVAGSTIVPLRATGYGLTEAQRAKFPHLWQYRTFALPAGTDVKALLREHVVVNERDAAGALMSATSVQVPGVLDDVYRDAVRAKLGPMFGGGGRVSLAVWAPTAQQVALELYDTPTATPTVTPMRRDDATGIWRASGTAAWSGKYYRYRVTAWQPAAQSVVTASVTDPYSVSLAADSTHSQIVDLTDSRGPCLPAANCEAGLAPDGWRNLRKPAPTAKPQIQELHVRDFSIADSSVPAELRGTYLAFTQRNSTGMTHLKALAEAGASHVHLLPVFDLASVPERRADQAKPACDLASLPPDSEQQQACVAAVADRDGYNWGYDPYHYSTPEGSYATDPNGTTRIRQFRQMVAGLNGAGLRVVVDVVYNHTPASGTARFSVLDQIVPGYYHRRLDDGTVATSTCCANTAPEHAMMGKLVVDSVVLWAQQYKVDGFRFDLMGHHPKANMLAVRAALDKLTLARDGVDGKRILLYGEGWNFGEVADNARFEQATQGNMAGTGIATFNDRLRDGVRGGGPFDANPRRQGFASGLYTDPNGDPVNGSADEQRQRLAHQHDLIQVGLAGNLAGYRFTSSGGVVVTGAQVDYNGSPAGYTAAPGEAVTYVDAHDNEILYDALGYKLPATTAPADRARMQVLALSTAVFSQGIGFVTAGSDLLRSKSLDRNSYNSGDWFNQIRWDCTSGNGFGAGLPPAQDNRDKWPYAAPLLRGPALVPDCATVGLASSRFAELLRIRASSPVFDLASVESVQRRLAFPLAGPSATPGVITMTIDGRGMDRRWRSVTVVFNATPSTVTQRVVSLRGADVGLHPVLAQSADPVARTASFDPASGTFTVPARTVAVYVQR